MVRLPLPNFINLSLPKTALLLCFRCRRHDVVVFPTLRDIWMRSGRSFVSRHHPQKSGASSGVNRRESMTNRPVPRRDKRLPPAVWSSRGPRTFGRRHVNVFVFQATHSHSIPRLVRLDAKRLCCFIKTDLQNLSVRDYVQNTVSQAALKCRIVFLILEAITLVDLSISISHSHLSYSVH